MKVALLSFILLLSVVLCCSAQADKDSFEKCLLTYNEVNDQGVEKDVLAFGWFTEYPYVPAYTYFDRDANRKVTIRTKVDPYQNENLADLMSLTIYGSTYGFIMAKCKNTDEEFVVLDLQKLHPDFIGLSLAVEIKLDPVNDLYVFESFPFEEDFPFKFAEDVVFTRLRIEYLENLCLD